MSSMTGPKPLGLRFCTEVWRWSSTWRRRRRGDGAGVLELARISQVNQFDHALWAALAWRMPGNCCPPGKSAPVFAPDILT
jgi:hypothetical protein